MDQGGIVAVQIVRYPRYCKLGRDGEVYSIMAREIVVHKGLLVVILPLVRLYDTNDIIKMGFHLQIRLEQKYSGIERRDILHSILLYLFLAHGKHIQTEELIVEVIWPVRFSAHVQLVWVCEREGENAFQVFEIEEEVSIREQNSCV